MLLGMGCDLLIKDRLVSVLRNYRKQFLLRLCHSNELSVAWANGRQELRYFCQLWSIKEACSKALGTGITAQTPLSSMEISCPPNRAPKVILHAGAKQVLDNLMHEHRCKHYNILVSVSDERSLIMAVVMIEIW